MLKKLISSFVLVTFFTSMLTPVSHAQVGNAMPAGRQGLKSFLTNLPAPGTMVSLSSSYEPGMIKGLTVHKDNPFLFDFIVDVGQDKMSGAPLKQEGEKLIKYFLASLAIPEQD
ncbi:MAG: hypothetical protein HQL15_09695, partial [Candidatus Omnitrophica bacterium]|nr:hypothetical protein [Candidatus Omnitrophota bacterium]